MSRWSEGQERTLLAGWLLALWSPITYGWAAYVGQSTLMMADLLRRSTELVALFLAWAVYRWARKNDVAMSVYTRWETTANLLVAAVMGLSVVVIGIQAYQRFLQPGTLGDLRWGIVLGVLGVMVNGWFWRRHKRYAGESHWPMAESQYRLFRSKALLDAYVVVNLSTAAYVQRQSWGLYVDSLGALVPGAVLAVSAIQILRIHWQKGGHNP